MLAECDQLKWLPEVSRQSRQVFSHVALTSLFRGPYGLFGVWHVFRLRPPQGFEPNAL